MPKYRFQVEVDTIDELRDQLALLLGSADAAIARRDTPATPATMPASGFCPNGHGAMGVVPAGTARSGPRIGQPYPAFLKCATCGTRAEIGA